MTCLLCRSEKQAELTAEMIIHFSGPKRLNQPGVWLFPKLFVCLECGSAEFIVPETELGSIANGTPVKKASTLEECAGGGALGGPIAS
jgi:hypothetical protein